MVPRLTSTAACPKPVKIVQDRTDRRLRTIIRKRKQPSLTCPGGIKATGHENAFKDKTPLRDRSRNAFPRKYRSELTFASRQPRHHRAARYYESFAKFSVRKVAQRSIRLSNAVLYRKSTCKSPGRTAPAPQGAKPRIPGRQIAYNRENPQPDPSACL